MAYPEVNSFVHLTSARRLPAVGVLKKTNPIGTKEVDFTRSKHFAIMK
jgi:hypothetical protein